MLLKNVFKLSQKTPHEKANIRIWSFSILVIFVMLAGVFGLYPDNALSILSPLNGFVMWFAIACVVLCIINLFSKEKVQGEKEFDNKSYFALLFTLGMGVNNISAELQ